MKLIDLDAKIIITVTDETKGGMMYEVQMTLAEFFSKCVPYYQPGIVDAIPVKWLENRREGMMFAAMTGSQVYGDNAIELCHAVNVVLDMWREEQEVGK